MYTMVPQEIQNNKTKHPLLKYGYLGPDEQVGGSLLTVERSWVYLLVCIPGFHGKPFLFDMIEVKVCPNIYYMILKLRKMNVLLHTNGAVVSDKWFVYSFSLNSKWCVYITDMKNRYCAEDSHIFP